jgi:regulator of Ty1 transposition protein 103
MRKRLDDEDYVSKPSTASTPPVDAGQTPKKSAAAIAAEVADKLAASSSSQLIMTSVLSTFAAQEAKNAGLVKVSPPSNSHDSMGKPEKSMPVADPNAYMSPQPFTAPPNHSYQSVLVPQSAMQNQVATSQAQYHIIPNPSSQQYLQAPGGIMAPYGYNSMGPLPPGPPPPPPHMVSPMVPLTLQVTQQQTIPLTQQPPAPPSFRPLQPPGMVFYGNPHHSQ